MLLGAKVNKVKVNNKVWGYFNKAYYINLDYRIDRNLKTQEELQKYGIKAERFSGIRPKEKGDFINIGARGCTESHLEVIKKAKQLKFENILIMEDDIKFSKNINQQMKQIIPILQRENWDMFYLGYDNVHEHCKPKVIDKLFDLVYRINIASWTHCYAIKAKAYDFIISEMMKNYFITVDGYFYKNIQPKLIVLAVIPMLAYQNGSKSDINTP